MSNVGSRKRKNDASAAISKKARTGGSVSMLRPRILRAVDAPKPGDKMYQVSRLVHVGNVGSTLQGVVSDGGGYQQTGSVTFSLNQIPNYLAWTACFREYRIVKAVVEFHPSYTTSVAAGTAGNAYILGWIEVDNPLSTSTAPLYTTENAWLNQPGYRQVGFNDGKMISVAVSPSPFMAVETTPTNFNAGIGQPSTWLLTSQPTTPHYGLAYRVYQPHATSADNLPAGELYVRYTVQFRQAI